MGRIMESKRIKDKIIEEMCSQMMNISSRLSTFKFEDIEEFEKLRHEWAEIGVALAKHIKHVNDTKTSDKIADFDRAMESIKKQ